ncbi:hypothetical protein AURANDRAFT_71221 [Aureococcus anophagefferens]|uniref:PIPK domain-containing protein n=1 Tax=Aureococcus anophagefferens TaxID=44056 RepID=F0Y351_AURAN|nr:hypothetical protein AURANDRAFT_71221 [Aureococcus anophagefferens]EGB10309.1 hypothetical protein AURANDRAFT_71221 [Aureococcus anophagefferens]|eukprot:XP_009035116.1 hypothetical protein AURANDRAFT_71221 [Aureococcus anophagefferens]
MAAAAASPPAAWQQNVALLSTDAPGAKDDGEASDERKAEGQESPRGGGWNARGTAWVHGEKARGTLDVTGDAATAIAKSNELPEKHRPHRVPRIGKFFRRHIKKPTRRIKPPKGKVIDGRHEQYTLSYTMQLGIQRSVEYAHGALPDSFDAACAETIKTKFPPGGSDLTPEHAMRHAFTAKDYAPCVFSRIRALMGVTPELYLESLCSGLSFIDFIANSRSGQFFFYSFDGVFMIKTVRQDEKDFLLKLLPGYYKHLLKHAVRPDDDAAAAAASFFPNGNASLLTRFYGLHCTKLKHLRRKVHFVVMSSIYGANTSSRMTQFDLKGSLFNRSAKAEDKVLKDRDALDRRVKLRVDKAKADALLDSARHDAAFLARHGVMDYSLLVGIFTPKNGAAGALSPAGDAAPQPPHDSSPRPSLSAGQSTQALSEFNSRHFSRLPSSLSVAAESARRSFRGAPPGDGGVAAGGLDDDEDDAGRPAATPSKAGHDDRPPAPFDVAIEGLAEDGSRELYYLGIIDILQKYTIRKHIETDINIVTKGLGKYRECSCVSPDAYRDRFLKFITHIF